MDRFPLEQQSLKTSRTRPTGVQSTDFSRAVCRDQALFSCGTAALLILKVGENGVLQSGVAPRKVGDRKTGTAIAPATFHKKAAQKSSRSGQRDMPGRSAFAISQHLLCAQRCIALLEIGR